MSLEDLEQDGILLPRDKWGTHELHTSVARAPLVILGFVSVVGCLLMYLGDGGILTWIGLGLFLIALGAFTFISFRGIR